MQDIAPQDIEELCFPSNILSNYQKGGACPMKEFTPDDIGPNPLPLCHGASYIERCSLASSINNDVGVEISSFVVGARNSEHGGNEGNGK